MEDFMLEALRQAEKAFRKNEVPIGAVIVKNGKVIARGFNKREKTQNALFHAEIIAINKACKKLKSWRLDGCDLYVTLEPCPMCSGAICNARIDKVIYATSETTSHDGLCEMILSSTRLNHKTLLVHDEKYQQECAYLLSEFFKDKRNKKT